MTKAHSDVETSPRSVTDRTERVGKLADKHPYISSNISKAGRVSFFVDELDRDLVDVIEFETPPAECWSDLYWSQEDKNEFLREAREYVSSFAERHAERVKLLEQAYTNCTEVNLSHEAYQTDLRTIFRWTHSNARGFEDSTTNFFWEKRCQDVDQILSYYAYLKETFAQGVYIDEKLRRYSERRSHCAREFAYKLAMGDALTK